MKTECFFSLKVLTLVLLLAPWLCLAYPPKPLNERTSELSFQAWLLVDPANQPDDLALLRRKITPKSVFIAPTFSPQNLPGCKDGQGLDAGGRCVTIIKLNEDAHYDFLLQTLKDKFSGSDYEDEGEEYSSNSEGPLHVDLFDDGSDAVEDEATEVAIIVAPTNGYDKRRIDIKKNDNERFNVENVAAMLGVKPEEVETTTIAALTTLSIKSVPEEAAGTTVLVTTTTTRNEETTTLQTTVNSNDAETTTETTSYPEETTTSTAGAAKEDDASTVTVTAPTTLRPEDGEENQEGQAIFFKWKI